MRPYEMLEPQDRCEELMLFVRQGARYFVLLVISLMCGLTGKSSASPPMSVEVNFEIVDQDQNGSLELSELFNVRPESKEDPLVAARHRYYSGWFASFDGNRDGVLSLEEYRVGRPYLQPSAFEGFLNRDSNHDDSVSMEEHLVGVPEDSRDKARRNFLVVDWNHDHKLDWEEFNCLPGIVAAEVRGPVPDPIAEEAERRLQEILTLLRKHSPNSEGRWAVSGWPTAEIGKGSVELKTVSGSLWDHNQDGFVTEAECRRFVELSFAIRHPSGGLIHQPNGRVLTAIQLNRSDLNKDHTLSQSEFVKTFPRDPKQNEELFAAMDLNSDGVLNWEEMTSSPHLSTNVLDQFLTYDADFNGTIDQAELDAKCSSWQRSVGKRVISAFDENGDGRLSFREYRSSPFDNLIADWYVRPEDRDHDGQISWSEYYTTGSPFLIGIYRRYFEAFDRDKNGKLTVDELEFSTDINRLSPQAAFRALDANANQQLEFDEYFPELRPESKEDPLVAARHRYYSGWFASFDGNRDGVLSLEEYRVGRPYLQPSAFEGFLNRDSNHDDSVSMEEHLVGVPEDSRDKARRNFLVVDWNHDHKLDWEEFNCLPGIVAAEVRGPVPDPIAEEAERRLQEILTLLRKHSPNSEGRWAVSGWPTAEIGKGSVELKTVSGSLWDHNQDGFVTEAECRRFVELSFAIRHPSGGLIHQPNGRVLTAIQLNRSDLNKDHTLSQSEFVKTFPRDPKQNEELFAAMDLNSDGVLNWEEMTSSPHLSTNVLDQFLTYDADFNGTIDQAELDAKCSSWQRSVGKRVISAFDENGDGRLSFREYRSSPFDNLIADWYVRPEDRDHDGQISWSEYYTTGSPFLIGIYRRYFEAFDRDKNGKLTVDELEFSTDINRLSPQVAFRALDANANQQLEFDEYFPELRPETSDKLSLADYETRLAAAESRFLSNDIDRSGGLDLKEYQAVRAEEPRFTVRTNKLGSNGQQQEKWDWSLIMFISLNVVAFGGIGWHFMNRSSRM